MRKGKVEQPTIKSADAVESYRVPEMGDVQDGKNRRAVRVSVRLSDPAEFARLVQIAWDRRAKAVILGPFKIKVEKLSRG